jgi:hypothetical protein
MTGSHSLAWWLTFAVICAGVLIWLGLSLFGFAMIFQGEGSYTSGRQLLIVLMDLFLALGCLAMVAALGVLRRPPARRRTPVAILVVVAAQLAVLLSALSLAHYVRSGEAWTDSTWRQLLADMGLVELFAYYPWLGAAALLAAAVVVVLMLVRLLRRDQLGAPVTAGPSPPA